MLCDFTETKVQKMQTNLDWQKTDQQLSWRWSGSGEKEIQGATRKSGVLEYIQYLGCGDGFMDYTYVNIYKIVHFKYMHFTVHLHSNESLLKMSQDNKQLTASCPWVSPELLSLRQAPQPPRHEPQH